MKVFIFLLAIFTTQSFAAKQQESDVRITFEDDIREEHSDFDGNDIVMCLTNTFETDNDGKIKTAILSVTPEAAGAYWPNAIYIRNPCDGGATIVHKSFDDTCDSAVVNT